MICKHQFELIGTIGPVPIYRCELLQMPCAEYKDWSDPCPAVDRIVPQPGQAHERVQVCSQCAFWEKQKTLGHNTN